MAKHRNCFDGMRYFAAFSVFFGHHFTLFGVDRPLLLGVLGFESLGVYIFFILSGFLIAQSWQRDPHLWRFLARRFWRLFPALAVVVTITALVLGAFWTSLPLRDYFAHAQTWDYFANLYSDQTRFFLPGVFESLPYERAVNGSLWSIAWEVKCYLALAALGVLGFFRWLWGLRALLALSLVLFFLWHGERWHDEQILLIAFAFGMIWSVFWDKLVAYRGRLGVLLWSVGALLWFLGKMQLVFYLLLPYVVLWLGHCSPPRFWRWGWGDWSYGIYLWAFPLQQMTILYFRDWGLWGSMALAGVLTLFAAAASWHLVEKHALSLKPKTATPMFRIFVCRKSVFDLFRRTFLFSSIEK